MIKLSKLTDYAIVILGEMAERKGTLLSATALSRRTSIPEPTVAKILKIMARGGLIASVRGAGGGYRLEKDARFLSIGRVIEIMEGPIALTACVEGSHESCVLEGSCRTRGRWTPVNAAIKATLANITLADMVAPKIESPQMSKERI